MWNNIVLISLDTLRLDCLTFNWKSDFVKKYWYDSYNTSKLDNIIAKWTIFNNCISAAPYTTASHAAYFTWYWPLNNNIYEFFNKKISKSTIFEYYKKNNYDTYFNTDFEIILWDSLGLNKWSDYFYVENENIMLEKIIQNKNKNTLSFFHFWWIHYPYWFHKIKFSKWNDYENKILELEERFKLKFESTEDILDESFRDKKDMELLLRYKNIIDYLYKEWLYNILFFLYIEWIDYFMKNRFNTFIDKVVKYIDETWGLLVIFSDHWEDWSLNSRGHSNSISDKVLKVPLIFYWKNIKWWQVRNDLIRTIDLLPTLLKYSWIKIKNKLDWKSINLLLNGKDRDCFSQVWRVWNKNKILEHQRKILNKKQFIKPLRTNLEKEICFSWSFAYSKVKNNNIIEEKIYKNNIKSLDEINIENYNNEYKKFIKKISKYNLLKVKKKTMPSSLNLKIKNELISLWYNI